MTGSLLRIDEYPVVDENDEVVLLVAGDVGDGGFAWLGQGVLGTAKSVLLEDLPAVAGNELAVRVKLDEVEIVLGRFHEDELFVTVAEQVAGDEVVQITV